MNTAKKLSWDPVRSGEIYCSSACGGGCTIDSYLQACKDADRLCEELGKTDWVPRVWENLGWHFSASSMSGTTQVHESRCENGVYYTVYAGGKTEHGDTPKEAVEHVRVLLTEIRDEIQKHLDGVPVFSNT